MNVERVLACVVVATLPFYLLPISFAGLAISATEASLLILALAVALRGIRSGAQGWTRVTFEQPGPLDAPIALFLAAALLSLLVTEYLRLSLRELRTLVVEPLLFFFLARYVFGSVGGAARLVDVLLLAAVVVALIAVGQYFLGGAATDVQGVRRVQGFYNSPNHLGLLLGRAVPFLVAGGWLRAEHRLPRMAGALVCAAALVLTFSLGAWLGTLAALLALATILGGRRALAIGTLAAATVTIVALWTPTGRSALARLDPGYSTTVARLELWKASLAMLAEQPVLGLGMDNFLYRYPSYLSPGTVVEPNLSHPHNLVLQFWLQLGVPGLVAVLWLLALFVRQTLPRTTPGTPRLERGLAAGALASMVDFVVHGLIDNSYFLVDMAFIFWLTVAISCQLSAVDRQQPHPLP